MKKEKSTILAAVAPFFADRCLLMSEQHTHAMLTRLRELAATKALAEAPAKSSAAGLWNSDATPGATIAVIPVIGVLTMYATPWDGWMGFTSCRALQETLAAAVADPAVSAIALDIDSPGGFVAGTVELADAIAAAKAIKPITAIIRGLCCSGAYWLASQCTKIISRPESEVANIGVYSVLCDVSKLYESMGVTLTLIASGQFKGLGADGKVSDDLVNDTKRINTGLYQQFVAAVAAGRGLDPDRAIELADGRAYLGTQAKKLGLIDDVATSFDATIETIIAGANAPESENAMANKVIAPAAANAAAANPTVSPPAPAPAPAPQAKDKDKKSDDGGDDSATAKVLNDTISTANAHRDQSRKALDHAGELADDDMSENCKSLASKCVAALKAASDEAGRASKALSAKAGKDPKDQPSEGGGDDDTDDESKSLAGYVKIFGGDFGAQAFVGKKSFAAATNEYIAKLKADHKTELDTARTEVQTLKTKLAAMPRGNDEALASIPEGAKTGPAAEKRAQGLTPGQAAFAGSLTLPREQVLAAAKN